MATVHFFGGLGTGILVGAVLLAIVVIIYLWSKYKKLQNALGAFFEEDCMTNLEQGLGWPWSIQTLPNYMHGYSQSVALFLTKAAAIASALHCSPNKWDTPPSFDVSSLLNLQIPGESIGYMINSPETGVALLVWRGTESQQDLVIDAEFKQVKSDVMGMMGNVHEGFNSVLDQLADPIEKWLKKYNPATVYVCGHSLGAGLTTLTAPWVAGFAAPNAQVMAYAFAPPDVGDQQFKTWAESLSNLKIQRFQNTADLVPTLPPGLPGTPYYEVGDTYLFRNDTGTAGGDHGLITYRQAIEVGNWLT